MNVSSLFSSFLLLVLLSSANHDDDDERGDDHDCEKNEPPKEATTWSAMADNDKLYQLASWQHTF